MKYKKVINKHIKYYVVYDQGDKLYYLCIGEENLSKDDLIISEYNNEFDAEVRLCYEINKNEE